MDNISEKLDRVIEWMAKYKEKTDCKGVVLGLSGGKDSTVVAMLSKMVFGDSVMAVLMPNGEQKDITDSLAIAEQLKLDYKVVNIETVYNSLVNVIENKVVERNGRKEWAENCKPITDKAKTNIPPRIRMTILYAIAQTYGYRVVGTGNKSEGYVGWCTKHGDTACDFNPLSDLTKTEVVEIGKILAERLGLDKQFVIKAPSDGLTGKTDEDNLGFTYEELDNYILNGVRGENVDRIEKMHKIAVHKTRMPYTVKDEF